MTISERMFLIMQNKGIKATALAEKLNVNKSVISAWKSRGTDPPSEYLIYICELLEVDIYTLLGAEEKKLTETEQELIKYFRNCNEGNKQIILNAASGLSNQEQEEPGKKSSTLKIG